MVAIEVWAPLVAGSGTLLAGLFGYFTNERAKRRELRVGAFFEQKRVAYMELSDALSHLTDCFTAFRALATARDPDASLEERRHALRFASLLYGLNDFASETLREEEVMREHDRLLDLGNQRFVTTYQKATTRFRHALLFSGDKSLADAEKSFDELANGLSAKNPAEWSPNSQDELEAHARGITLKLSKSLRRDFGAA